MQIGSMERMMAAGVKEDQARKIAKTEAPVDEKLLAREVVRMIMLDPDNKASVRLSAATYILDEDGKKMQTDLAALVSNSMKGYIDRKTTEILLTDVDIR